EDGEVHHNVDSHPLEAVGVGQDHQPGHVDSRGLAQVEPGVVGIDGCDQLELVVACHRLAHGGAHAARCTEHANPDRHVTVVELRADPPKASSSKGPTTASTRSPVSTRPITRATSSSVTASVRATSSSKLSTSPCTSS